MVIEPIGSRSSATNSTAASTPIVPKVRRVTELKNVLSNSRSGSASISSVKRRLMLLQSARSVDILAEPRAHLRDGAIDALVVQLDALDRIALAAAPVALFEALRRAPRDGAKLGVVVRERLDERARAFFDERVAGDWAAADMSRSKAAELAAIEQ